MMIHSFVTLSLITSVFACAPFSTNFPYGSVSSYRDSASTSSASFVSITPNTSFSAGNGLEMFLHRPSGDVVMKDGVNTELGEGATVNSTFKLLYGQVSFEIYVPTLVPGAVIAAILIADELDEIDIEMLGGDSNHWQSNVYAPNPVDKQPLWGVFGGMHNVPGSTLSVSHIYTIDWNADRIIWSVDGVPVRTLQPQQTMKNGVLHYPSHAARIQLGIWDASSPLGTAQWAKGPIDWTAAPGNIHAIIKSVSVKCYQS